jgi:Phosphate-selective porin O and P
MATHIIRSRVSLLLSAALVAVPSLAFAQSAPEGAPPAAPTETPAPPAPIDMAAPPPASLSDSAPADGAAAGPSLSDVSAKLDGLEEAYGGTKAIVDALAKIKVSGYIQGRYENHAESIDGVNRATGRATEFNRFFIRRGRLKVTYTGTNAEYMIQTDATGDGVVLKDAEASIVDSWTPLNLKLTFGQFKVPFGYEVLQSSGDREMPERSVAIRTFFPNERDRGVRLQASNGAFRFSGAVVNGNFIQDGTLNNAYQNTDNNGWKDVVARVGADLDWLVLGLSGSYGIELLTSAAVPAAGMTPAVPITFNEVARARIGGDIQTYLDDGIGGLALKAEAVMQRDRHRKTTGDFATGADPCKDVVAWGGILTAVQNVGDYWGLFARLDQYRANISDRAGCAGATQNKKLTTFGGGLNIYASANVKFTGVYEKVWGALKDTTPTGRNDDRLTLQIQAKF